MPAPHMQPKMAKALTALVAQQPFGVLVEDAEASEPVSLPQFHAGHHAVHRSRLLGHAPDGASLGPAGALGSL